MASYSTPGLGADLWIAQQAPELAEYHQGLVPEQYAGVTETRIMMAQEYGRRLDDGTVSNTDHLSILNGLLAFEDPALTPAVEDTVTALEEVPDPREVPGYLSAGNNAAAFILRNVSGLDKEVVLKVGHSIYDELNGCDRAAITNLRRWLGLAAGEGVDGFEQPIAFSAERPISVTKLALGVELFEISKLKAKPQPSEEALLGFANALYESITRRITIDIHGRDILYDPDTDELTVIDHSAPSRAYSHGTTNYIETVDAIVETFKASFGYEFDEVAFERLLDEFSKQGLHDLRMQTQK